VSGPYVEQTGGPEPVSEATVIVTGQPTRITVSSGETILDLRRAAVSSIGYDEGRYWEVRDPCGRPMDQTNTVLDEFGELRASRFFVNLPAGTDA